VVDTQAEVVGTRAEGTPTPAARIPVVVDTLAAQVSIPVVEDTVAAVVGTGGWELGIQAAV